MSCIDYCAESFRFRCDLNLCPLNLQSCGMPIIVSEHDGFVNDK